MHKTYLAVLLLFIVSSMQAQVLDASDRDQFLTKYDLRSLWSAGTLISEYEDITNDEVPSITRPEPIGFIGTDYQRFYIHFTSVIKNEKKPDEYFIVGKTRVKDNVCDFQGIMTIQNIEKITEYEEAFPDMKIKQYSILGKYHFVEDRAQKGTGILDGNFETYMFVDSLFNLHYDAIFLIADGYSNNQFAGTWQSYKTSEKKTCNWGDFRIPQSRDLDYGVAEFSPGPIYYKAGWSNYENLFSDTPEGVKAREIEEYEWWK